MYDQEPGTDQMRNRWTAVDDFLADCLLPSDLVLDAVRAANTAAGLPAIDVSPLQGRLLELLARMAGARRILEIGTLGGYSTIWLARALSKGGRLVTLEAEPRHAEIAQANITRAGLADVVDIRVGLALDLLPALTHEASFDFIFIDADKSELPDYLSWALKLSRVGTVIIGDNVVRDGEIASPDCVDPMVQGVQRFLKMIAEEPRLSGTVIQTVGCKGWDGIAVAVVGAPKTE